MEMISQLIPVFQSDYWTPNKGSYLAQKFQFLILGLTALYIPAVFAGQLWMRNRQAYKLKTAAFVWNFFLSMASGLGVVFIIMSDWRILLKSFYPETTFHPTIRAVVAFFTLTKVVEFGDTVFLVLWKKPVRFLHAYHHVTVALYGLHSQLVNIAFAHHFVFLNLSIHFAMYMYYALSSIFPGNSLLRSVRPFITISQVLQMFIGILISLTAIVRDSLSAPHCLNAWIALIMYMSYAYFFGKFYLENYGMKVRPILTFLCSAGVIGAVAAACVFSLNGWSVECIAEYIGGSIFSYAFLFLHMYSS